jgi:hypothetical protein
MCFKCFYIRKREIISMEISKFFCPFRAKIALLLAFESETRMDSITIYLDGENRFSLKKRSLKNAAEMRQQGFIPE